jgi:hypothetical protein
MTAPGFELTFVGRHPADLPSRPTLTVVIDTEEEFDWCAPFSRAATSVTAMRHIERIQRRCEVVGLRPTYVVDYPVATQTEGYEAIAAWARAARCEIGAHLHPWVTPPFDEPVTARNSFVCNLPPALQRAKLTALCEAISANIGAKPTVFKAGRYGIGPDVLASFGPLGLDIDVSVNPGWSFTAEGGPEFLRADARPFWIDRERGLLEVPCTTGFVGWARGQGAWLREVANRLETLRAPGILALCGAVDRVMLSPEGNTLAELVALTRTLLADGLTFFSFTLHSPSLAPGYTPYVRSAADLSAFLSTIERYFEFFFAELGGEPSTPERYRRDLLGRAVKHA